MVAGELAKHKEIESIDLLAGVWDLVLKVRSKDQDAYYELLKTILAREGIQETTSLISLKQVKNQFVPL